MHCKSLWIKASAKCINVNVNISAAVCWCNDVGLLTGIAINLTLISELNVDAYKNKVLCNLTNKAISKTVVIKQKLRLNFNGTKRKSAAVSPIRCFFTVLYIIIVTFYLYFPIFCLLCSTNMIIPMQYE